MNETREMWQQFRPCKQCGTWLPCTTNFEKVLCGECEGDLSKCTSCKTPCRSRSEMEKVHERIKNRSVPTK